MTFLAAVAAGDEAVRSLEARYETEVDRARVCFARHLDLAVVWAADCQWIASHEDSGVLVVLDGRLHNLDLGSTGPVDALLRRYRALGTGLATGLLGDFVVIVLDRRRGSLLVARDPVGVRPWYHASAGRRHAGASDLATLASLPWVSGDVNERIAIEYLSAVPESRGETIYRGITTLRPGQTWHMEGGRDRRFSHHRWAVRPETEIPWEDAAQRCRLLLDEAVRCRLKPDAPATSELSGGLDSSSVVGTAALMGRDDLMVGRLLFDGPGADERRYSDAVIDHWGLAAVSVRPWTPGDDESQEWARRLRRPVPDPNLTMFASLYRTLRERGRPDSLTGLGGDDAFLALGIGSRVVSAVQLRQRKILTGIARTSLRNPIQGWTAIIRPTLGHLLRRWRGYRRPVWVSTHAAARADLRSVLVRSPERVTGIDAIDRRMASLTSGYDAAILEDGAIVADAEGRRSSHPFLDPRFVEGTYGFDPSWPVRNGHTRALEVAAFNDRLPPAVANRRSKAEFSEVFWAPMLQDDVLERVRRGPVAAHGWLDAEGFDALTLDARRGMTNAAIPLARCVLMDQWMRTG